MIDERQLKWDKRFMLLAITVSAWSKDPSTKCGAVIVRPDKTVASLGFNGFPRGMEDKPEYYDERSEKYSRIIHAEMNAIIHAREPLCGYTLYCTFCPCERCAVHIIQAGIKRVVIPDTSAFSNERWKEAAEKTTAYFEAAGVEFLAANK